MLKKLAKTVLALATGVMLNSVAAHAENWVVESAALNLTSTGTITVIAEDGKKYSKLESDDLTFDGNVKVTMAPGSVSDILIFPGACGALCNGLGFPLILHENDPEYGNHTTDKEISFPVPMNAFPQGLSQNLEASKMFSACSKKMGGYLKQTDKTITHNVQVTLGLQFDEPLGTPGFGGNFIPEWWDDYLVPVTLVCKALDTPTLPDDVAFDPGAFKVLDMSLSLATATGPDAETHPNPATTCKKGRIRVALKTNQAGLAAIKLSTSIAGAISSKDVFAQAHPDGNGGFEAEYVEWVSTDKPGNLLARAEEVVGAGEFGKDTPWKQLMLQCKGGGENGGFSQDTSDYEAKAVMALYDANGKDAKCPRTGHVGFTFSSNYSKPINYRLTSNTGMDKFGTVQLSKSGSEWKGLVTVPFPVNKNLGMGVVLRHIQNGVATIVATKTREYQCKNTTAVDTGSDDLVHDTNPVEPVYPTAKYTGELTLADSANVKRNSCPREGQAVFKINSNNSTDTPYTFVCTNGQSWQGNMTMFPKGPGKYQGVAAKTFPVTKTENVACVLKRVKGNKAYLLTAAAKQYNCVKSTGVTASDDLAPSPQPGTDPDLPQAQSVKGDFSFVDYGSPKCTRTGKALVTLQSPKADNIHLSLDCKEKSHSFVVPVAPNPAGGYSAVKLISFDIDKTIDESCTLRTVAPYGPKDHVTKQHLYQCVTPSGHSASNDVQVPSNPPSGNTSAPQGLVVPTGTSGYPFPPWQCQGGYPRQSGCTCPPHKKLIYTQVHYHGHVYNGSKCVLSGPSDKTTAPGSSTPDIPQLTVACKDKEQRVGGKCVKIPGVSIHCKPGFHQEGTECVRNPVKGVSTVDKAKSDAVQRRIKAAKDAAAAKRKREQAAARARRLKAAQDAAIAKRKRDAAAKAAAAFKVRTLKARQEAARRAAAKALATRNAAAALARSRAALKKRAAPSSIGSATRMPVNRRR